MNISIMMFPFMGLIRRGEVSPMRLFQTFKTAGCTGLELGPACVPPYIETWKQIQNAAQTLGMTYSCLDLSLNLLQPTEAKTRQAMDEARRAIEFTRKGLNCDRIMVYGSKPHDGLSPEDGRKRWGERGAELADFARDFNVEVLFEDFGAYPYFVCTADQCVDVLKASGEKLRFTFDNGNFIYGGDEPKSAFAKLAKHTRHVHLKDFVPVPWDGTGKKPDNVPGTLMNYGAFGEGSCEIPWCIKAFQQAGYDGWFSIELCGAPDLLAFATESIVYCANIIRG